MDFKTELQAAADACVAKQLYNAEHLIRQAFYDGVAFEMKRRREERTEEQFIRLGQANVVPCPHGWHPKECFQCR